MASTVGLFVSRVTGCVLPDRPGGVSGGMAQVPVIKVPYLTDGARE